MTTDTAGAVRVDTLSVTGLTKNFGGLSALSNLTMRLGEGELVGLIGPNGAGKTTVFNLLTGVYEPTSGSISFRKQGKTFELGGLKPYRISQAGVSRTFQNIRLFKDLSALENVVIALQQNATYKLPASLLHGFGFRRHEEELRAESMELLKLTGLDQKASELARNLPYGEQRHLEIARALATKPTLLLLDEPAAGMNPNETAELTNLIFWLREHFQLTILLIEHDMSLVMKICERIYVLDHGVLISEGTPDVVKADARVIEAYLGQEAD